MIQECIAINGGTNYISIFGFDIICFLQREIRIVLAHITKTCHLLTPDIQSVHVLCVMH